MVNLSGGQRDTDRPLSDVLDGLHRTEPELMALQIEIMTRIHEAQVKQREILEAMRATQERWVASLESPTAATPQLEVAPVSVSQVPMRQLVGMMLRIALAAAPAVLLIGFLWLAAMFGMAAILSRSGLLAGL